MKKRQSSHRTKTSQCKPVPKWLCVFEIDDSVAPRRVPDKPNVRAEALAIKPGQDLESWVAKSPRATKLHITRVLYTEMPAEGHPGGVLRPYNYPDEQPRIKKAIERLNEQLRCRRYTVNGCQRTWRLYVIELDETKVPGVKPEHKGAVYVGETYLTREERAKIHREGKARTKTGQRLWSNDCHRYFKRPRPDLLPASYTKDFFCESSAKIHETKLRLHLEGRGYKVLGGKDRLDRFTKKTKPPA
jgi:hypothetical protein